MLMLKLCVCVCVKRTSLFGGSLPVQGSLGPGPIHGNQWFNLTAYLASPHTPSFPLCLLQDPQGVGYNTRLSLLTSFSL